MLRKPIFLFAVFAALATGAIAQTQLTPRQEIAELQRIEKLQLAAKAAYQKSPKDARKKKEYVALTLALGNRVQTSGALTSKIKYPKALRLFREALTVDPKNREAIENRDRIEMIYKSMGRPIPK